MDRSQCLRTKKFDDNVFQLYEEPFFSDIIFTNLKYVTKGRNFTKYL